MYARYGRKAYQSVAVCAANPRVVVDVLARRGERIVAAAGPASTGILRDVQEGRQGREGLRTALDQRREPDDEQLQIAWRC